jgi:hypothetical protein
VATLLRRFLVLVALMFWLGGFTFYASIVIPIGQKQLGGPEQGKLTAKVTNYLNLSGAFALAIFAWDLTVLKERPVGRRLLWACWAGMALTLGLLVYFHGILADMVRDKHSSSVDDSFNTLHSLYLWTSTLQWLCGVAYTWLTLGAWRTGDRLVGGVEKR